MTTKLEVWLEEAKGDLPALSWNQQKQAIAVIEKLKAALEHYDQQLYYEESEFGSPDYTMEEIENYAREALAIDPDSLQNNSNKRSEE